MGESKASQARDSAFSCALLSLLAPGGWIHRPLEERNCKLSLFALGNEVFMAWTVCECEVDFYPFLPICLPCWAKSSRLRLVFAAQPHHADFVISPSSIDIPGPSPEGPHEFRFPRFLPVRFVMFLCLYHVTDLAGAPRTFLFGLIPATFVAQRCELSSAPQVDAQDLWSTADAAYVVPAAAPHHT